VAAFEGAEDEHGAATFDIIVCHLAVLPEPAGPAAGAADLCARRSRRNYRDWGNARAGLQRREGCLMRVGIIGVGEIGRAIVHGLCVGPGPTPRLYLSPRSHAASTDLARRYPNVLVCAHNQEVADNADIVILAVPPTMLNDALTDLRIPVRTVVVSTLAGVTHDVLRRRLGDQVSIVRAIPLPAVRRRQGITAILPAQPDVKVLFDRLGGTLELEDDHAFATLSAATGSISTHLRYIETIAAWVGCHGVDPQTAGRYVRSMFAGIDLADTTRSLHELVTSHETAGGLNEELRRKWFDATGLDTALDSLLHRLTHNPEGPTQRRPSE
jgi:pyrroline-5-carboxylate reductase